MREGGGGGKTCYAEEERVCSEGGRGETRYAEVRVYSEGGRGDLLH